MITGPGTRVMSLRDGAKKMSKSDESDLSRINLTDSADTIAQKIRKARTDAEPLPSDTGLKGAPGARTSLHIYAGLADTNVAAVLARFGGAQFSSFKQELADVAVAKLMPIADEMRRLLREPASLV